MPPLPVLLFVDGDASGAHVTVRRYGDTSALQGRRLRLPSTALDRTGLEKLLNSGRAEGAHEAAVQYASHLAAVLDSVWPTGQDNPVVVAVSGPAAAHRPLWEALYLIRDCVVVHLAAPVPVAAPFDELWSDDGAGANPGELLWLGARPFGDGDLPRYLVLGEVLAEVLGAGSAIEPVALLTAARRIDLDPERWPAPSGRPRIVQLDAHGESRVEVAGDGLDAVFSFHIHDGDGSVAVPDRELLALLQALDCTVFLSNSCFAAQQRGIDELPFPARVVSGGSRAALGAREPLRATAAVALFRPVHAQLSAGAPLWQAMRAGLGGLKDLQGLPDERAYRVVQPVLWLAGPGDLNARFGDSGAKPGPRAEIAALAARDEVFGALLGAVEDRVWAGKDHGGVGALEVVALPSSGLGQAALGELGTLLSRAFGASGDGPPVRFAVPRLSFGERLHMVAARFDGSRVLHELLADLLAEDPAALTAASRAHDRTPELALLDALAWGGGPGPDQMPPDGDSWVQAFLRQVDAEPSEDEPADVGELRRALMQLRLALPAYAQKAGVLADGMPLPWLGLPEDLATQVREGRVAGLVRGGDTVLIAPYPRVRDCVRVTVPPRAVHTLSVMGLLPGLDQAGSSDRSRTALARASILANLALAVAARQVGSCDVTALGWAVRGVGRVDVGAAIRLVRTLETGLPGWAPLHAPLAPHYQDLVAMLDETDAQHRQDIREDHEDWQGWTGSALTALHAEQPQRVLELVASAQARLEGEPPWELRKLEAYALARTGRPGEAMAIAASAARAMPSMSAFDQAELLHLLGDLADRRGRRKLAVRYLLDERSVDPPSRAVRLHNRRHLLRMLRASRDTGWDTLALTIAREGLELARQTKEDPVYFADVILELALEGRSGARLEELLHLAGADGTPRLRALTAGYDALERGATADGIALLAPLLDVPDSIAAHAALRLGNGPLVGAERIRVLRLGSQIEDGRVYAVMCSYRLMPALWEQGEHEELAGVAEALLSLAVPFLSATARTALGALALTRGETTAAAQWYGEALALGGPEIWNGPLVDEALEEHPETSYQAGAVAHDLLADRLAQAADRADPTGLLADANLVEIIDRWATIYFGEARASEIVAASQPPTSLTDGDPEAADGGVRRLERLQWELRRREEVGPHDETAAEAAAYLVFLSERLWDQEDLEAALAARSQACRLYEEIGDQVALATELGWTGAITRQAGRPGEAEATYQRAIAIGTAALPADELAFIVGRYGNLLHEQRDFAAAIHQQWRAVCILCGKRPTPPLSPDALAELGSEVVPAQTACRWALLLTNLANCLAATGHPLLQQAVGQASKAYHQADRLLREQGIGGDANLTQTARLLRRLGA
ncbi:hypothetical protein ABZV80_41645 [Streptomyces sp. NPDC005132]|uniref:hypothetical protein n=1 Tax=Streptomyces sp. NPDC005132 TaxID=3154294 RepID=UPI00339E17BD